jgi:hypothetical protein
LFDAHQSLVAFLPAHQFVVGVGVTAAGDHGVVLLHVLEMGSDALQFRKQN